MARQKNPNVHAATIIGLTQSPFSLSYFTLKFDNKEKPQLTFFAKSRSYSNFDLNDEVYVVIAAESYVLLMVKVLKGEATDIQGGNYAVGK